MTFTIKIPLLTVLALSLSWAGTALSKEPAAAVDLTESEGAALDWQPFHARYSVYHNGKLIGKSDIVMDFQDLSWTIKSESSGTHGLARLLRARENGYVQGHFESRKFMPDRYTQHTRVMGFDKGWTANFNWQSNAVRITQDDEELTLDLGEGALDPLSITLEIRRRLRENDPSQLLFLLVDEDKLKDQEFRILDSERLDTSLGCIKTVPVERIHPGNTRYTRAWHAPELEFLTVRMEHGKYDGDHIEMRIADLTLGEQSILPAPGC
jgi:hypothetical protein